jgi:hypothetical protein
MISKIKKNRNGKVEMKNNRCSFQNKYVFYIKVQRKSAKKVIYVRIPIKINNRKRSKNG